MRIEIGNQNAVEKVIDPQTHQARFKELPGERVTTFLMPEGIDVEEAFNHIVNALPHHMRSGAVPAWIEGDNANLVKKLCQHYGILLKDNKRPREWGSNLPRVRPEGKVQ